MTKTATQVKQKGTFYYAHPSTLEQLEEKGSAIILSFAQPDRAHEDDYEQSDVKFNYGLKYVLSICTDSPDELRAAINDYYSSNHKLYLGIDYNVWVKPTKVKSKAIRQEYPHTVFLSIGLRTPFSYQDLIKFMHPSRKVRMSSIYNNGIKPTAHYWYLIPNKYKQERNPVMFACNSAEATRDLREFDRNLLERILEEDPNFKVHYRFPVHERHTSPHKLDSAFSMPVAGSRVISDVDPLGFDTCDAEVIDCRKLKDLGGYGSLIRLENDHPDKAMTAFRRITRFCSPYLFRYTWFNEVNVNVRLGLDPVIHHSIDRDTLMGNLLVQVIRITKR